MSMAHCVIPDCTTDKYGKSDWCQKHKTRWMRHGDPLFTKRPGIRFMHGLSEQERFWSRVDAMGVCWEWTGGEKSDGYGGFDHRGAHLWSWENLVGPIPRGKQIDHLCKNRRCVNPDHLEPVTPKVNVLRSNCPPAQNARKTSCSKGHAYTGDNFYYYTRPDTGRTMRVCRLCRKSDKSG